MAVRKPKNPDNAYPVLIVKCNAKTTPHLVKHMRKKYTGIYYWCFSDGSSFKTLPEMRSHIMKKYGRHIKVTS